MIAATMIGIGIWVVNFYGIHPAVTVDFGRLNAPVLGLFAEKDGFVNAEAVVGLQADLKKAGKLMTTHVYKGADHAFFNDTRPDAYRPEAAADGWRRAVDFLHGCLGGRTDR